MGGFFIAKKKYTFIFPSYFFVCCAPGSARSSSQVPRSSVLSRHHPPLPPQKNRFLLSIRGEGYLAVGTKGQTSGCRCVTHTHKNNGQNKKWDFIFPPGLRVGGWKVRSIFIAATLNIGNSSLFWRMIFGGSEINN